MSSLPPKDQSIAGAILQTATRVVTSLGLGVTTAAFTSLSDSNSTVSSEFRPYRGTWWVSLACAGLGLVFLPFISIERQGNKEKSWLSCLKKVSCKKGQSEHFAEHCEVDGKIDVFIDGVTLYSYCTCNNHNILRKNHKVERSGRPSLSENDGVFLNQDCWLDHMVASPLPFLIILPYQPLSRFMGLGEVVDKR